MAGEAINKSESWGAEGRAGESADHKPAQGMLRAAEGTGSEDNAFLM